MDAGVFVGVTLMNRKICSVFFTLMALALPARALTINFTYDSSVASQFGANTANLQSALNYAAGELQGMFTDNMSVNITVYGTSDPSILGKSDPNLQGTCTYAQIRTKLTADNTTTFDDIAISSLGTVDPTSGGKFWIPNAEAKAIGLRTPLDTVEDGKITFGSSFGFAFDPNNRAVPGRYDFIGLAEHVITQVMGRSDGLGRMIGAQPGYLPYDLFRYTQDDSRSLSPSDSDAYFSIDSGATVLKTFNSSPGGGLPDWASGTADAFNAFPDIGVVNALSSVDMVALDSLGYNAQLNTVPEPSSYVLLSLGAGGFMALKYLRSTRLRRKTRTR